VQRLVDRPIDRLVVVDIIVGGVRSHLRVREQAMAAELHEAAAVLSLEPLLRRCSPEPQARAGKDVQVFPRRIAGHRQPLVQAAVMQTFLLGPATEELNAMVRFIMPCAL